MGMIVFIGARTIKVVKRSSELDTYRRSGKVIAKIHTKHLEREEVTSRKSNEE